MPFCFSDLIANGIDLSYMYDLVFPEINGSEELETHQWQSGPAFKTGRRQVQGLIPGRACRTSRSEFFVVFFETCVNTG